MTKELKNFEIKLIELQSFMSRIILPSWQALFNKLIRPGEFFEMYFFIVGIGLLSDPNTNKNTRNGQETIPYKSIQHLNSLDYRQSAIYFSIKTKDPASEYYEYYN